jgi:hypothetical protein
LHFGKVPVKLRAKIIFAVSQQWIFTDF